MYVCGNEAEERERRWEEVADETRPRSRRGTVFPETRRTGTPPCPVFTVLSPVCSERLLPRLPSVPPRQALDGVGFRKGCARCDGVHPTATECVSDGAMLVMSPRWDEVGSETRAERVYLSSERLPVA
ncbi:unnamed protein product [Arctogadus glacialis]